MTQCILRWINFSNLSLFLRPCTYTKSQVDGMAWLRLLWYSTIGNHSITQHLWGLVPFYLLRAERSEKNRLDEAGIEPGSSFTASRCLIHNDFASQAFKPILGASILVTLKKFTIRGKSQQFASVGGQIRDLQTLPRPSLWRNVALKFFLTRI